MVPLYSEANLTVLLRFTNSFTIESPLTNESFQLLLPPSEQYQLTEARTLQEQQYFHATVLKNKAIKLQLPVDSINNTQAEILLSDLYSSQFKSTDSAYPLQNFLASKDIISWYRFSESNAAKGLAVFLVVLVFILTVLTIIINRFPII